MECRSRSPFRCNWRFNVHVFGEFNPRTCWLVCGWSFISWRRRIYRSLLESRSKAPVNPKQNGSCGLFQPNCKHRVQTEPKTENHVLAGSPRDGCQCSETIYYKYMEKCTNSSTGIVQRSEPWKNLHSFIKSLVYQLYILRRIMAPILWCWYSSTLHDHGKICFW